MTFDLHDLVQPKSVLGAKSAKTGGKNRKARFSSPNGVVVAKKCQKFGNRLKNSYLCSVERKMGKWAPEQRKFGFRPARIYYLPRA